MKWASLSWISLSFLNSLHCFASNGEYTAAEWRWGKNETATPQRLHGVNIKNHKIINSHNGNSLLSAHYDIKNPLTRKLTKDMKVRLTSATSTDKKRPYIFKPTPAFNVIRTSPAFVDKTLLLKEWIANWHGYLYVTAPTGFGKSSILDMIRNFCDTKYRVVNGSLSIDDRNMTGQHALFSGTNLFTQEKYFFFEHFMRYNVIHINLAPLVTIHDYDSFKRVFCGIVKSMIEPYRFLLNNTRLSNESRGWIANCTEAGPESDFCLKWFELIYLNSGNVLLTLLRTTFDRPVVLIVDGYDSLLGALLTRKVRDADWITDQLVSFIGGLVKHTVDKALFMGSLDVEGSMPALANKIFHQDYFENEFVAKFFGFSGKEVMDLLQLFSLSEHYGLVKNYCGGYTVIKSRLSLFSIVPVLRYIQDAELRPFISESFSNRVLLQEFATLFSRPEIGRAVASSVFNQNNITTAPRGIDYRELVSLKENIESGGESGGNQPLAASEVELFLNLVIETGLFSVFESNGARMIMAANEEAGKVLLRFLERSQLSRKLFDVSESSKKKIQQTVICLQPDRKSIERFGDGIHTLFTKPRSLAIHQDDYLFYVYTFCKMAARLDSESFEVEGGARALMVGGEKLTSEGQKDEKISILLVWKQKGLGVVIEADFKGGARAGLDRIIKNRLFNVFKTRPEYSKCHMKHTILIGVSVTCEGEVSMSYLIDSVNVKEAREYRSNVRNIKAEKG